MKYRRGPARFASVAEVKDRLSEYLLRAKKDKKPVVITRHGKPYALLQPIEETDLEDLDWRGLSERRLRKSWEEEDDALYDYL